MSLTGQYDPDNIFAKIMAGDIPCAKIYEDDDVMSFMDAFPQSRGHCLVIPKAPCRNILDADPAVLAALTSKVQMIAKAVNGALTPDGIVVTQFNGAPAGQTVFHLHFHIIPRYEGAQEKPHASGSMADMAELQALTAKIKHKL